MKTYLIIAVSLIMTLNGCAKEPLSGYKKFYQQYEDADHIVSFKVPGAFANFFIDKEDKEVKDFTKKMDNITFLISENPTNQIILDLNKYLPESEYKQIMVVKDGSDEVTFLAKVNGKAIEEIIMTVYNPDNLVVMCMKGDFTKEDAKQIAKAIKVKDASSFRE